MPTAAGVCSTTPSEHSRETAMVETDDIVLHGGCLCGSVRYEVRPDSLEG